MKQSTALDILKSGRNVFLTGQAGSGKTYVLNKYIQYLKHSGVKTAVTASTGIAATHLSGKTIHSRSGVGIKDAISEFELKEMFKRSYLHKNIGKTKVLIIDEISMLSAKTLDTIEQIVRYFIDRTRPFGGIQVVVCGDFFQLPPVVKYGEDNQNIFAWQSDTWAKMDFSVCYLSEQYRQQDTAFLDVLNKLRNNNIDEACLEVLRDRHEQILDSIVEPTKLYTHNIDVDRINDLELSKIKAKEHVFRMTSKGKKTAVAALEKGILAQKELRLKKGASVIFIKNSTDGAYSNGTLGKVIGFDDEDGLPVVKIGSGKIIKTNLETWVLEDGDMVSARIFQVPLKLAWAITVHKSQGMSLDAAEIDLSKVFEYGQAYVALSRVKSLSGLRLIGLNESCLGVHPEVLDVDISFREVSHECDTHFTDLDESSKMDLHKTFVEKANGFFYGSNLELITEEILEKKELKKEINDVTTKEKKISTYDKTKFLIEQKKTLGEISDIREITPDTVVKHFFVLRNMYPELSFLRYKPDGEIVGLVKKAIQEIGDKLEYTASGDIKIKPIFEKLNEEFSYSDIRLALLFL